jgi:hypothetical protein
MSGRRDDRHSGIIRSDRLLDADEGATEPMNGPPADSCYKAASRKHQNSPHRRRSADTSQEALLADHGIDTVTEGDALNEVKKHCQRHAAEPSADSSKNDDYGQSRQERLLLNWYRIQHQSHHARYRNI